MPAKPKKAPRTIRRGLALVPEVLEPLVKPLVKPIVHTVATRLDKHENLLLEMKQALDVQFRRIAEMQAQLDHLLARLTDR